MIILFVISLLVFDQLFIDNVFAGQLGIINGEEVTPFSIPYQVNILLVPPFTPLDYKHRWKCGGVLITKNYVLTSARCLIGAKVITPLVGIDNPNEWYKDGQFYNLENDSIIIHQDYDPVTFENNLGLIKTPGFNLTEKVVPASIPFNNDVDLVGQEGRLSGYSTDAGNDTEHLMAVNNTIISNAECSNFYNFVKYTEICVSGDGKKRACIKDEGGPLTVGNIVYGIISFRNVTCESSLPTVVTRISSYLDWIQTNSDWTPN